MTPCAISSQPPRIRIHACSGTEAGSHAVPDPACGEGNCEVSWASIGICIGICIPLMEVSCAEAGHRNIATITKSMAVIHQTALPTNTSHGKRKAAVAAHANSAHSEEERLGELAARF